LRGISGSLKTQDYENNSNKTSYTANPDQFLLMHYPEAEQAKIRNFILSTIRDPDAGINE
jgi:type VI protein secretion system component Hcp